MAGVPWRWCSAWRRSDVRGRDPIASKPIPPAGLSSWATSRLPAQKVQLNPVDDTRLAGLYPHAIVQGDGSFQLTTYKTRDGRPVGTYALQAVTWPLPPGPRHEEGPDRFQGRYSDRHRPVAQVLISAGENNMGTIPP